MVVYDSFVSIENSIKLKSFDLNYVQYFAARYTGSPRFISSIYLLISRYVAETFCVKSSIN